VCEGAQNIRKSYVNKINYFLLNFPNTYEIIIEKKCLSSAFFLASFHIVKTYGGTPKKDLIF